MSHPLKKKVSQGLKENLSESFFFVMDLEHAIDHIKGWNNTGKVCMLLPPS